MIFFHNPFTALLFPTCLVRVIDLIDYIYANRGVEKQDLKNHMGHIHWPDEAMDEKVSSDWSIVCHVTSTRLLIG